MFKAYLVPLHTSRDVNPEGGSDMKLCHAAWDRCYDFSNIFAETFGEKIGVFSLKTKLNFEKI
jgi:hypothetical protein